MVKNWGYAAFIIGETVRDIPCHKLEVRELVIVETEPSQQVSAIL